MLPSWQLKTRLLSSLLGNWRRLAVLAVGIQNRTQEWSPVLFLLGGNTNWLPVLVQGGT